MDTNRRTKSRHEAEPERHVKRILCERPHVQEVHCWPFPCGLMLTIRIDDDGETGLAIQPGDDVDAEPEQCGDHEPSECSQVAPIGLLPYIRRRLLMLAREKMRRICSAKTT